MRLAPKNENVFLCEIELTNKCNYRCSYCPPFSHAGKDVLDYNDVLWYVDKLIENNNTKTYSMRLYGGEPVYYRYIDILLKELYNRGVAQHFVTNASRPIEWWEESQQFLSGCIISMHMEYADVDHIVNVCKTFDADKPVYVQQMIDPKIWDTCIDKSTKLYNELLDVKNALLIRKPINQRNKYKPSYTPEQNDFVSNWYKHFPDDKDWNYNWGKLDNNIISGPLYWKEDGKEEEEYVRMNAKLTGGDNFFGWLCNAGTDGTIIDAHGEVHRSACTSNISIGNIKNRKVEMPTKGIICDKYACSCFTDLQFRKYRTI